LEARGSFGETALSWASKQGRETIVKLLLDAGANPYSSDDLGRTPLSLASKYGHETVAKLLREQIAALGF
jgi:ankyrin repeat protein